MCHSTQKTILDTFFPVLSFSVVTEETKPNKTKANSTMITSQKDTKTQKH